jgi:hypothetical protein
MFRIAGEGHFVPGRRGRRGRGVQNGIDWVVVLIVSNQTGIFRFSTNQNYFFILRIRVL